MISKFLENAKAIEFDAVARDGGIVVYAICEHVENAGVHSGDATLVFPPQRTYLETIRQIRQISKRIATHLNIHGPFNIQFIAKDNEVKVIECNLRASRSFPFVSKVITQHFIEIETKIMTGPPVEPIAQRAFELHHVGVKAPEFPFTRPAGPDPHPQPRYAEIAAMAGRVPTVAPLNAVVQSFANAPVPNPDGTTGIDLILLRDEINEPLVQWAFSWTPFANFKIARFGTAAQRASGSTPALTPMVNTSAKAHWMMYPAQFCTSLATAPAPMGTT